MEYKIYVLKFKVTILSVSDNKIRITIDDKKIPAYNQEGNLSQELITKKSMVDTNCKQIILQKEKKTIKKNWILTCIKILKNINHILILSYIDWIIKRHINE